MSTPDNSGPVTADLAEQLIQEALRNVEARERGESPAPQGEPPAAGGPPAEVAALQREVEELRAQLELSQAKGREVMEKLRDTHERMLRAAADLDNFKKRAAREKDEVQKFGIERVLKDLLPVMDNLERALTHADTSADSEGFKTGVRMTARMFEENLGRHGVKAFSAKGQPFDPHVHEAMQQVESAEVAPNTVVAEVMRGYMLHERLIRPAMVVVSKAPAVPLPGPESAVEAPATTTDSPPSGEQS